MVTANENESVLQKLLTDSLSLISISGVRGAPGESASLMRKAPNRQGVERVEP